MVNPLDLQLPSSLLWTFATILFFSTSVSTSDPCPPAENLLPCSCTDFLPYQSSSTSSKAFTTTSTSEITTTPTTTPQTNSTPAISTVQGRKRRHIFTKRQIKIYSLASPSKAPYYTVVTCDKIKSIHDLEEGVIEALQRRWIDKLIISNYWPAPGKVLVRLPNGLLRNTRLKQFEIRNTPLAGDFINSGSPLDGQAQSLMWFTASNCSLRGQLTYSETGTVHTMGLKKLLRLVGLNFSSNYLEYIRDSAFRSPPPNVTTIILSHNKIKSLERQAFYYVPKLRFIDLSHNSLESISRSVFPSPAMDLSRIDLSWNHLTGLPPDFFSKMPALKIVNVSNNYLYSMPSAPWITVWRQLQVIDATGNYLPCDCSLMWLIPLLSPSGRNGTTPAPGPLPRQTILGSCSYFQYDTYPELYYLANLTRSSLDC